MDLYVCVTDSDILSMKMWNKRQCSELSVYTFVPKTEGKTDNPVELVFGIVFNTEWSGLAVRIKLFLSRPIQSQQGSISKTINMTPPIYYTSPESSQSESSVHRTSSIPPVETVWAQWWAATQEHQPTQTLVLTVPRCMPPSPSSPPFALIQTN